MDPTGCVQRPQTPIFLGLRAERHTVTKIGLVGHSHAIAFLDDIAVWRPLAGLDQRLPTGFPESHRGWFTELTGSGFVLDAKPEYPQFSGIKAVLFTAAIPLVLVTSRNANTGQEIRLAPPLQPGRPDIPR